MCLIVFAWQVIPGVPLIAAGNRDEFYARPSEAACWWPDHPHIYAGRDCQGGGTWMGITRGGRFAAVTNIRAPSERRSDAPSRGALVADFLKGEMPASEYIATVAAGADVFNGFNLLVGDCNGLYWYSNRGHADPRNGKQLSSGIYGLSNALLDDPWPKVIKTKAEFCSLLCQMAPEEAYFEMLTDTAKARDCCLPSTGVDIEWERALSAVCIESPEYGTRASTLVRLYADGSGAELKERPIR